MALLSKKRDQLPVVYIDDEIVLSNSHAWTYVRIPVASYEFLTQSARETLAIQLAMAMAQLVSSSQETVSVHLKVTHRPFDTFQWETDLDRQVTKWGPKPGWGEYRDRMADYVDRNQFQTKDVHLGVCLGPRAGKGSPRSSSADGNGWLAALVEPFKRSADKLGGSVGLDDPVVPAWELTEWRRRAVDVRRVLRQSAVKAVPVPGHEVARLVARPWFPNMEQPPVTAVPSRPWGPGDITSLFAGTVVERHRWVEVTQPGFDGELMTGYAATLAVSRFPDVLHYPDAEPWIHFAEMLPVDVDFSTRMEIVPAMKVKKDIDKRLADAKDQAGHIASTPGASVPLKVREQLEVATVLEYQIDKSRDPWAYARHRITVTAGTPEELAASAKTIIEKYNELGIDVSWPSGEQYPLLQETIPGEQVRSTAYYQRQELITVAGGMPHASGLVGDQPIQGVDGRSQGWVGPYIGYSISRELLPVFFSPHVAIAKNRAPGVAVVGPPGGGKALALDTPLPTPTGWVVMGDVQVGDELFDETGQVCTVTHVTGVFTDHDCYEVEFDDGSVITADADHRWLTNTTPSAGSRNAIPADIAAAVVAEIDAVLAVTDPETTAPLADLLVFVPGGPGEPGIPAAVTAALQASSVTPAVGANGEPVWSVRDVLVAVREHLTGQPIRDAGVPLVRTTRELHDTYANKTPGGSGAYTIPVTQPIQLPNADVPVDPYLFGVWLTSGVAARPEITTGRTVVLDVFHRALANQPGMVFTSDARGFTTYALPGLLPALTGLNVINDKHIPMAFLRASEAQRRAVLQGMVDADGHTTDGNTTITFMNKQLTNDVRELIHSLGMTSTIETTRAILTQENGTETDCGEQHTITFQHNPTTQPTDRVITNIRPVTPVPVRCITVNSPSHLYLAGNTFIPTHNTFFALTMTYQMAAQGVWTIYIDPKADAKELAKLPGLGNSRVFDLAHGNDGILDPFSLVGTKSERTLLAVETIKLLLGGEISSGREEVILEAVERVAQHPNPSLNMVVEELLRLDHPEAGPTGRMLRTIREMPFARLCFAPTSGASISPEDGLTIITLIGLDLPGADTPRDQYTYGNRLAVAVMYLLTTYTRQLMLNMNKSHPKAIVIDEAWAITATPQGAKLVPEIARMGRSHNTVLVLVSQNAADLSSTAVANSITTKFAFRATHPNEIADVLKLFDLEDNPAYYTDMQSLRNGQCLMYDVDGRVAAIQIDNWNEEQQRAFDTNPETRGKERS